jgi:hypothetical protein
MKLFIYMKNLLTILLIFISTILLAQTKVSGVVVDEYDYPVPFANVIFKSSTTGTITDENGRFYLESSERHQTLQVSFVGYETKNINLIKAVTYKMNVLLKEGNQLSSVTIYSGKQSKKNNPAIDILKKIWANKRSNGTKKFKQYQYDKYEKIEFDFNNVDSTMAKSKLFKGMEFIFEKLDTSRITGKTYLPIFLNESVSKVYGNNENNKNREDLIGNKNSGFSNNQTIISFVKDLYSDYNVYDNYLKIFDKSFVSPLSKTGVNVYNYVLSDSAYIGDKWCYNIVYYPRRKNELTFKGDFWVNDSTWAIKDINLQVSKSANINWVKDIYIEQEFDVLNDSVFLIKRDYFMSDFSFSKKDKSKGVYGKRTTLYEDYQFDTDKGDEFYKEESDPYAFEIYNQDSTFWSDNRLEKLNKDEEGVYKMLDTLKTVAKFKRIYNTASILASGYVEVPKLKLDFGPIFSTFGYNDVEGIRLRAGGRTYFGPNDKWRVQGYGAYGFKDNQFKYGLSGKWLLSRKNRWILSGGNRRDIEQIGVSLTTTNDILGRSFASSSLFSSGSNDRLTSINLSTLAIETELAKNFIVKLSGSCRTLKSASSTFGLDFYTDQTLSTMKSELKQSEANLSLTYTPNKKTTGYGVERSVVNDNHPTIFVSLSQGVKGVAASDFDYSKVQLFYRQPWQIGGFGRLFSNIEVGKTFGEVPLGLLSVIPGNQAYFSIFNTFPLLDYYDFVTDTYASVHLEHNFNGRIFSRIPFLKKMNLREIVAVRGAWGDLSQENINLDANTPNFITTETFGAPHDKVYWEYSLGVGNIFKVFRIDFNFRGNYFEAPNARKFGVTGSFGFNF